MKELKVMPPILENFKDLIEKSKKITMKKIAIRGSQDYSEQQEILEILRSWGGMNSNGYSCDSEGYYYINSNNIISLEHGIRLLQYELLTLKEYKEKYMSKENNKEFKIEIPEGYEVDKENSTFEKIVFKKVEEKLTYEKIIEKLFYNKVYYYTDKNGTIKASANVGIKPCDIDPNNAPTEHQLQRLLALNKLMNTAYYLNNGWKPDWENTLQIKFYIYYNHNNKIISINFGNYLNYGIVYFKSKELAQQAIEILGEETIKLALGVC